MKLSPGSGCLLRPHQVALVPSLPCRSFPQDGGQRRSFPGSQPLCQPGQGAMGLHAHPQDASSLHTHPSAPDSPVPSCCNAPDCILCSLDIISLCPPRPQGSSDLLGGTPGVSLARPGRGVASGALSTGAACPVTAWMELPCGAWVAAHVVGGQRTTASCPTRKALDGVPGGLGQAGLLSSTLVQGQGGPASGMPQTQCGQSREGLAACR